MSQLETEIKKAIETLSCEQSEEIFTLAKLLLFEQESFAACPPKEA